MIDKAGSNPASVELVKSDIIPNFQSRSLEAYISETQKIPMLTLDEERDLAIRLRENNDLQAAQRMVMSHLRLVVSTARSYISPGIHHADLIQEGNIGLMKAVKRFDERNGARLGTYALPWIKAEMLEYLICNSRIARVASSKPQRKLFFGLNKFRAGGKPLSYSQIQEASTKLGVSKEDVIEMECRLSGNDVPLDDSETDSETWAPINYLATEESEPTHVIERAQGYSLQSDGLSSALESLDPRSRKIIESRWLCDEDVKPTTLTELATEFGVSMERVRQIESAAIKKMRGTLTAYM